MEEGNKNARDYFTRAFLLLQVFIQPVEEGALPEHSILRFLHPVPLIRKI